jgi:hypothetical protein
MKDALRAIVDEGRAIAPAVVRYGGETWTGAGGNLDREQLLGMTGEQQAQSGLVRLRTDEIKGPRPQVGRRIEVQQADGSWGVRTVTVARTDRLDATLYLEFGGEFR